MRHQLNKISNCFAIAALGLFPLCAHATIIYDNGVPPTSGSGGGVEVNDHEGAAQFTISIPQILDDVSFYVSGDLSGTPALDFAVFTDSGDFPGTEIANLSNVAYTTSVYSGISSQVTVPLNQDVLLPSAGTYWIAFNFPVSDPFLIWVDSSTNPTGPPISASGGPNWNLVAANLTLSVDASSPTPEASSLWLIAGGFSLLLILRRVRAIRADDQK